MGVFFQGNIRNRTPITEVNQLFTSAVLMLDILRFEILFDVGVLSWKTRIGLIPCELKRS